MHTPSLTRSRVLFAAWLLSKSALAMADDHGPLHYLNIQTINPQTRAAFLDGMRNNATQSRKEEANIVFDVADVGGNDPTLVLFESWRDRAGYNQHEASAHVAPVIALVPSAFARPERKYLLQSVAGLPGPARKAITDPSATWNVVVRLSVKPAQAKAFIDAAKPLILSTRAEPGNRVFDVYQDRSDPRAFVIYGRWASDKAHERHEATAYAQQFDRLLSSVVERSPEVLVLKDRMVD